MPKECGGWVFGTYKTGIKSCCANFYGTSTPGKTHLWIKWVHHYYTKDFWNYLPRPGDSPLFRSLLRLRDELRENGDSRENITDWLNRWFDGPTTSLDTAYQLFFNNQLHWQWKAVVCKPGIVPKHRFSLWMFAHKNFLTKHRQMSLKKRNVCFADCILSRLTTYFLIVALRRLYGLESGIGWD